MDIAGEFSWEIKAHVAAALCVYVSDDQLKYWREREAVRIVGPVPHPSGRGRTTLYAPGTGRLVVRLIQLLQEHRSLGAAMKKLAIEGFPVDAKWIRNPLIAAAQKWDTALAVIRKKAFIGSDFGALSDVLLEWLDKSPRFEAKALRLVRKLVGSQRCATFAFHMLRLALGIPIEQQPNGGMTKSRHIAEDHKIIVTGLGFRRLTIDRFRNVKPMADAEIVSVLDKVAERLRNQLLVEAIKTAPNETLLRTTREIEAAISNNKFIFQALFWVFGRHAFGRGHAARIFDSYGDDTIAMITALWVVVRVAFVSEAAEQVQLQEQGAAAQLLVTSQKLEGIYSSRSGQERELRKTLIRSPIE